MTVRGWLRCLVVCLLTATAASAQESVIVVRHAERADGSNDSPLSPAGLRRAERLATVLKDTKLVGIFTSTLQRTIQTAKPTAAAQRVKPIALKTDDLDGLVRAVASVDPNGHVLIVGHSNTIPQILRRFGVAELVTVADDDFANIFVVVHQEAAVPQLIRLRY
jgi:broad specificity phosphatase PhoE